MDYTVLIGVKDAQTGKMTSIVALLRASLCSHLPGLGS